MKDQAFMYENFVKSDWVDYNGHMNDAAYAKVFSLAVDSFIEFIGLDAKARIKYAYTIFTLETHLCYLREAHLDQVLQISVYIVDVDIKRMHVFFSMENSNGEVIATSEQMLMGINTEKGKPAPFPSTIAETIEQIAYKSKQSATPQQVGRQIGIKR